MSRRILTAEQKQRGFIGRVLVWLFGTAKVQTNGEKRKGKLQSKRVWGIMLLVGINVVGIIAKTPLFDDPKVPMILNMVATILTSVGIVAHRVKTYGLSEVFGELDK